MGPRSHNRGYGPPHRGCDTHDKKLQWVHGPITVVMHDALEAVPLQFPASMGPRSHNRGYAPVRWKNAWSCRASMGPRSHNRGYDEHRFALLHKIWASMGPRSHNRGYGCRGRG